MEKNDCLSDEQIKKLFALCPNNQIASCYEQTKQKNKPHRPKRNCCQRKKNLYQIFKTIKMRDPDERNKNNKANFACGCKKRSLFDESCTTVNSLISSIKKLKRINSKDKNLARLKGKSLLYEKRTKNKDYSSLRNFRTHNPRPSRRGSNMSDLFRNDRTEGTVESDYSQSDIGAESVDNFFVKTEGGNKDKIEKSQSITSKMLEVSLRTAISRRETKRFITFKDTIRKDVKRTFQQFEFFRNEDTQNFLESFLCKAVKNTKTGYVQGMNNLAGAIIYHCKSQKRAMEIYNFIIERMEMNLIYSYSSYDNHIEIFKEVLKNSCGKLFNFCDKVIGVDYVLLTLDFYFCLFFNKIPLELSFILLENYIKSGWYYFYRLVVALFMEFEKKYLSDNKIKKLEKLDKQDKEVLINNFYKEKGFNWKRVLKNAEIVKIDTKLVRQKLDWKFAKQFK